MPLKEEIEEARREIVSDGYEMSLGELVNLYRDQEIIINPAFQRLFRWDPFRKTRFMESILLGIPFPPIFVYQDENGVWELIDGLQRLSTVFEFMGILRIDNGSIASPSSLEGTKYLPSLAGKRWDGDESNENGIGQAQQIQIKRARLRVEILKSESDPKAKYELFQRLNTGGAGLSEQEVRNCVAVMINKPLYDWLIGWAALPEFVATTDLTEYAEKRQAATELALRFFAFRSVPYQRGLDVHEYLDNALIEIASSKDFDTQAEGEAFRRTFELLDRAMGDSAFKRWNGQTFMGKFLMSVFEVVATGVSSNLDHIEALPDPDGFIVGRCKSLWENTTFQKNSGAGIRGTTRLANLLPMAREFFRP
jgi:hypothetical protein